MGNTTDRVSTGTGTILSGATTSDAINVRNTSLVGIRMPAAFTGTSLTLTESDTSDGTFTPVYDASGSLVTIAVGTSRTILLTAADFIALNKYIKLVSNAAEGADRSITLLTMGVE